MMNDYNKCIQSVHPADHAELLEVWESSVTATHAFLETVDFMFYKNLIPSFFLQIELHCVKGNDNRILGFIGTQDDNVEMLFVRDSHRGKGVGKTLLTFAIHTLQIRKVDVNQQNESAIAFYNCQGFVIKRLSPKDGFGKSYPIAHMELAPRV